MSSGPTPTGEALAGYPTQRPCRESRLRTQLRAGAVSYLQSIGGALSIFLLL